MIPHEVVNTKYPRTGHFPFSPGTSDDDKVQWEWEACLAGKRLVYTEKLDGGNTMLSKDGVFARSHLEPASHPSFDHLKPQWAAIRSLLGGLCLYGENMFAVHSLEYPRLTAYFYVFAVREGERWLSWEDVYTYAELAGFPTVPELAADESLPMEARLTALMRAESGFGGPKEGIVVRDREAFSAEAFQENVIKYVRAGHVQTDADHWMKGWRQAQLLEQ